MSVPKLHFCRLSQSTGHWGASCSPIVKLAHCQPYLPYMPRKEPSHAGVFNRQHHLKPPFDPAVPALPAQAPILKQSKGLCVRDGGFKGCDGPKTLLVPWAKSLPNSPSFHSVKTRPLVSCGERHETNNELCALIPARCRSASIHGPATEMIIAPATRTMRRTHPTVIKAMTNEA